MKGITFSISCIVACVCTCIGLIAYNPPIDMMWIGCYFIIIIVVIMCCTDIIIEFLNKYHE